MPKVNIIGSGLSGLVAAIDLAKYGYEVTIFEGGSSIGACPKRYIDVHPSLHVTPLNIDKLNKYIGINLNQCFKPVKDLEVFIKNKKYKWNSKGLFIVERGQRKTSVDYYLYKIALKLGVKFEFSKLIKKFKDIPDDSIIATGLFPEIYDALDIPSIQVNAYSAVCKNNLGEKTIVYFDEYTDDYFYSTAMNGIRFFFLFGRKKLNKDNLKACIYNLKERYNIKVKNWKYSIGRIPVKNLNSQKLFYKDKILTGTLAGFIDPFFLFGVKGALLSGKIASLAIRDKRLAIKEFKRLTRNFNKVLYARKIYEKIPAKMRLYLFSLMVKYPHLFKPVTMLLSKGMPDYTNDWMATMFKIKNV